MTHDVSNAQSNPILFQPALSRGGGMLLHPTSLPGPHGIGSLGSAARIWIELLKKSGLKYWQILPLGPTGYGNSPYQCYSAFAGNPLLIDLADLLEQGLLKSIDSESMPEFDPRVARFEDVSHFKHPLLRKAFDQFKSKNLLLQDEFAQFSESNSDWLHDYSLFQALKSFYNHSAWFQWAPEIVKRETDHLNDARKKFADEIAFHEFLQFIFLRQWKSIRKCASENGISIIGDMPIFVSYDSVDVWSHKEIFQLLSDGHPKCVAGVPPDYFSETGQLWGNPLYEWKILKATHYSWWIKRIISLMDIVDIMRIDHFRGFESYWEVPANDTTAIHGRWVKGPGEDFFKCICALTPKPFIIAEDLGFITPDVYELRDRFNFPGMKVLLFAFSSDSSNPYLPHNYSNPNCVVYTGTHDNETVVGYFNAKHGKTTDKSVECSNAFNYFMEYTGFGPKEINWSFIRLALSSTAAVAIIPVQDVLGLGSECRMNTPGKAEGNWGWRLGSFSEFEIHIPRLKSMLDCFGR